MQCASLANVFISCSPTNGLTGDGLEVALEWLAGELQLLQFFFFFLQSLSYVLYRTNQIRSDITNADCFARNPITSIYCIVLYYKNDSEYFKNCFTIQFDGMDLL